MAVPIILSTNVVSDSYKLYTILRWPRRVIHCNLRRMKSGNPQWNSALEAHCNGSVQWQCEIGFRVKPSNLWWRTVGTQLAT